MKRRAFLGLIAVLVFAGSAFGQTADITPLQSDVDVEDIFGSIYAPGDISVSASVGFGYALSLAVYPGVEVIVAQPVIADAIPISIGVAARGYWNRYRWSSFTYSYGWTSLGVGSFATFHLALTAIEGIAGDYLNNMDFYAGLGPVFTFLTYDSSVPTSERTVEGGLGFASIGGLNWFFTPSLALVLEGGYWGYYGGGTIGLLFKL